MPRPVAAVLFAAALALTPGPPAAAQDRGVEEAFLTADGVKLRGVFHPSPRADKQNDAVVVLLYPPGAGNTTDSNAAWAGLTRSLLGAGFHVFQFDWRGHGRSTDLDDAELFWNTKNAATPTGPWNQKLVKGVRSRPIKISISAKPDFDPKYFPMYVNDLDAVRQHLDAKNDKMTVNTSSVYLVGAGDTAALGLLWQAAEWRRPATGNGRPLRGEVRSPAGADIAGSVWLGGTRSPAIKDKVFDAVKAAAPKLRDKNPMLFLYAEKDAKAAADGKFFFDQVLAAKGSKALNPLNQTFLTVVNGTSATGANLLSAPGAEEEVLNYLAARQKDRASIDWKERRHTSPSAINLAQFGLYP